MKAIVVNRCYGGFGLSREAEDLLAEKMGLKLYRYVCGSISDPDGLTSFTRATDDDDFLVHAFTKDHGDVFVDWPKDTSHFTPDHDIERDDPLLVEVVRELGSERASSDYAALEVVEIPDDVAAWTIEEYDGMEHIAEAHRTW